ncbi:MAG: membrane-binding protein [Peptococcaceae bacterium]|jgi:hypothetical protein|nr:membrane-binding protein [Peptococcaceae bacterium]
MGLILMKEIRGMTTWEKDEQGRLLACKVGKHNVLPTVYGDFVPRYSGPDFRRRDRAALTFYANGSVRGLELEAASAVSTLAGTWEAEYLAFHEDGSLSALFPRNGQLNFAWSEEDEGNIVPVYDFSFPFGSFRAKIISMRFFPSGSLRVVTLWPDERIELTTPVGRIPVRIGFRLHEDGRLAAVEPASPVAVRTPIGEVTAYHPLALGLDAGQGSLQFDPQGNLLSLATVGGVEIRNRQTGTPERLRSPQGMDLSECSVSDSLRIRFAAGDVYLDDGAEKRYALDAYNFYPYFDIRAGQGFSCSGDCEGCAASDMDESR